ncbi:lytic polysaccharide monooxygenase [Lophiostoma macrostomum CBS 122681]|uniref:AA9 family lytic polysaccharide monooxygenase n=1 Tax=Lophiostoma macrostomum CBS 122681 TaxID=1314788 RepID=A0A6A6TGB3_9PLEO|nr:lytic polysaccharide monooxygenase [Lophiostoma macrostomum CBS 122681]
MKTSAAVSILAFTLGAGAHGGVYSYEIDGVIYNGYKWFEPPHNQTNLIQRRWTMWPVEDPSSSNLTCNFDGGATLGAFHAPIKAGSSITARWIGEQGLRPGYTLNQEAGWPQFDLIVPLENPKSGWTLNIPKTLKPGNYMIRHEILMLEQMPPQFYPECAQLKIEGDGTAFPSEEYLVKFPGPYKMTGRSR